MVDVEELKKKPKFPLVNVQLIDHVTKLPVDKFVDDIKEEGQHPKFSVLINKESNLNWKIVLDRLFA